MADTPEVVGAPTPWAMNMQTGYSPVKRMMVDFHDHLLLWIIVAITIFVLVLLLYVMLRYNSHANPKPKNFAHNTTLEVIWTAIPVFILLLIVIPSYKLLYFLDKAHHPEMTLKVTGHQWYWSYEYPDQKIESFDSRPIWDGTPQKPEAVQAALADASKNWIYNTGEPLRLLEVDNRVVLPVDTEVRVYVTGADVIHSWGIPAFGLKEDANPGHLNETWVKIDKPGLYYGQCSELCGTGHGFMPIVIEAVAKDKFAEWVKTKATVEAPAAAPAPAPAKNKTSSALRSSHR
ncbi:MAG TPA: cytochrome c oxidase subunit II [Alphaproteobacteria bacterium]|nr:cytochrome c oxidase subunit II [Alphaproteobacteria bacterium]